jgi:sec-independent protein translocase protein TatA
MGAISPVHLIFVLIIALFVIGPQKLPETGAALGKAIRQFREAANGAEDASANDAETDPSEPAQR